MLQAPVSFVEAAKGHLLHGWAREGGKAADAAKHAYINLNICEMFVYISAGPSLEGATRLRAVETSQTVKQ